MTVQSANAVDLAKVNAALEAAPGIELVEAGDYPTAVGDAVGQDVVYVGRVRGGIDDPAELNMWLTSDNVRKGAALNAVQVAELLIKSCCKRYLASICRMILAGRYAWSEC